MENSGLYVTEFITFFLFLAVVDRSGWRLARRLPMLNRRISRASGPKTRKEHS